VDATRFDTGLTYEAFKDTMTQNRERLDTAEAGVEIDRRDLEFFRSLRPLRCVALAEDWCGDVIANLPVVAVLAREVGPAFELRCFVKADVPDLATRYLNHGRFESLPVFAFFDEAWNEVGVAGRRHGAARGRPAGGLRLRSGVRVARCAGERAARRGPDPAHGGRPAQTGREHAVGQPAGGHHDPGCHRARPAGGRPSPAHAMSAKVRIVYCAECGYEPQTLALADALMRRFGHDLASIELVPWLEGTFEVSVDGQLVHSMARDGGFPEHATVIEAVNARLAAGAT
jgi:selenoprotein W-related protein